MPSFKADHSLAAIHIVLKKVTSIVFTASLISTFVFFGFNIYMILSKINDSLPHTIFYSITSLILVGTLVLDILFHLKNQKQKVFLEKKRFEWLKKVKRRIILITKLIVKMSILAVATYEIVVFNGNTLKVLALLLSYTVLIIQIIVYFTADFLFKYWNYLYIGMMEDLDELPISSGKHLNEKIRRILIEQDDPETLREEEIIAEIERQKEEDIKYRKEELGAKIEFLSNNKQNTED